MFYFVKFPKSISIKLVSELILQKTNKWNLKNMFFIKKLPFKTVVIENKYQEYINNNKAIIETDFI